MTGNAALPGFIEVIFYDFDGVLVESNQVKIDAFRRLYAPHGEAVVERVIAEHVRQEGISRTVKIKRFHQEFLGIELSEAEQAELAETFSGMVEEAVVACDAVPGAMQALAMPGERRQFVVSGTPEEELRRIVAARGMQDHFQGVHGSPRTKMEIVGGLLRDLRVAPERALFVGDAITDFEAARHTGVPFLGRVPEWRDSPFPAGTPVTRDLWPLARLLGAALIAASGGAPSGDMPHEF